LGTEAQQFVWQGAIPLQIHLHESEVTTLTPPPPALILAPRIGYLPLLVPQIKPYFSSSLPPGADTVWFEYKGFPLKWYIPTGVLFDLLCAEPERPWNLIIHFRGYPGNILTSCEGEDSVKWSFINALKEAAYIITGNCKNIMNMSQSDQAELWRAVLNGQIDAYLPLSSKLKLEIIGDDSSLKSGSSITKSRQGNGEIDSSATGKTACRIPVRLYIRTIDEGIEDLEDAPAVESWDEICYINRPMEIYQEEGERLTLLGAIKALLPETFAQGGSGSNEESGDSPNAGAELLPEATEIKLIRIQGIEPLMEIPFGWVVNNLRNPEHYLHICLYLK
ncbi:hypothetical protein M569_09364, partial [Genlisea aurea]